jgi:membrane-bound metal-dependent hydrolase YbcI (DUF457 family)
MKNFKLNMTTGEQISCAIIFTLLCITMSYMKAFSGMSYMGDILILSISAITTFPIMKFIKNLAWLLSIMLGGIF